MNESTTTGEVVWERYYDEDAARRRWKRFFQWYVIPLAIVLGLGAAFGGMGAFLGLLILLGSFGAIGAFWIWIHGVLLRQNPTIRLDDGALIQGNKTVKVEEIEAWTTYLDARVSRTDNVGKIKAQVIFRIPAYHDGERDTRADGGPAFDLVLFGWGEMPPDELEEVRAALDPHIDAPWVPLDELRA